MGPLLFLATHVEDGRATDGEARDVQHHRHLVADGLGIERLLVLIIQPQPAVLAGKADAGESAVVQPALNFTCALPQSDRIALQNWRTRNIDARHVGGEPSPGSCAKLRNRLDAHPAPDDGSMRQHRRCRSTVPHAAADSGVLTTGVILRRGRAR